MNTTIIDNASARQDNAHKPICLTDITTETIQLEVLQLNCNSIRAGAQVSFLGHVRNHHNGQQVLRLEYEAHQKMARSMLSEIVLNIIKQYNLEAAACIHRIGRLDIGDVAVAVITAAAHRQAAYVANQEIINEVKAHVPIWKKEFYASGKASWL